MNLEKSYLRQNNLNGSGDFAKKPYFLRFCRRSKRAAPSAYSPSGVINETVSSYDAKGNSVETWQWVISKEKRNLLSRATFAYLDDYRKTVATYFDSDGTQVGSIIANKNSDGSNIKIEHQDAKGNLVDAKLFVRKFDSMGNWIVENVFQEYPKNGSAKLIEITNRTITYY